MGLEARCTLRHRRRATEGDARLETAELSFRGDGVRMRIPFASIASLEVVNGMLKLQTPEGAVALELGPAAAKWADKIRNPKPVIDKLGVKPGMSLSVIGEGDTAFLRQARARADAVSVGRVARESDLVFFFTDSAAELKRLAKLRQAIRPNGAVWVVWPKGRPALKEDHARAAAIDVGLVDVKVVAFSATHSALKLVIRLADR
jgi:hypothetical protein